MIEVNDNNFYVDVIEKSKEIPVLVDFWSPSCQPCLMLGPVLERLEKEYQGKFILAKLNVQDNQKIAAHYGIRSIPLVKLFKEGNSIDEFLGALPEVKIKDFLRLIVPSEADIMLKEADDCYSKGEFEKAIHKCSEALDKDPDNEKIRVKLGRMYFEQENFSGAKNILKSLVHLDEANKLLNIMYFREFLPENIEEIKNAIEKSPEDLDNRLKLANQYALEGNYRDSMEEFLEVVRRDKKYKDEEARKAILKIFIILGNENSLVTEYRKKLSDILF